jgi:threonine/homoserine/homoserine lactone efflux protein
MFLLASLILAITPGPGVIYVVTRTPRQGRRAGLTSVLGIALGNFANAAAASVGLAALLAASATAFTILKMAGAAYLIFLGVRAFMARPAAVEPATSGPYWEPFSYRSPRVRIQCT